MERARSIRARTCEAVLVGALAGSVESARAMVAAGRGGLGAGLVLAALATVGWVAVAMMVEVALAGLQQLSVIAAWRDALASSTGRAVAIWRGALALLATLLLGWVAYRVGAHVHVAFRFRDPEPVGLLLACLNLSIVAAVLLVAGAIDRRVAPRLAGVRVDGRRAVIAGLAAALLGVVLPVAVVACAVPATSRAGVVPAALCVTACVAGRALGLGARRGAGLAAVGLGVLAMLGVIAIRGAELARGLAVEQGTGSRVVVRRLFALADRDGDGYPGPLVGGADCDDNDPRRSPAAIDVAGNGLDENCTGADAPLAPAVSRDVVAAAPAGEAAVARPLDIVLISIDALRADHLGAYGYARPTSPQLDGFAATAVRFARAYTASPTTRHALPALLAGRAATLMQRGPDPHQLAEVLAAAGYATAAILCCDPLIREASLRGFASVDASPETLRMQRAGLSNADAVTATALRWLGRPRTAPYFLWLHYYDPHYPYVAPEDPTRFGTADLDRYDGEIRYLDGQLARVLAALDPATTIVALTADHGDEFDEHGIRFHARSLYNQVTRVPLLVRAPDVRPRVVDVPVSLTDVAPTLLDLVSIAVPPEMTGRSLAPALRGATLSPAPVLLELSPDRQIDRDLVGLIAGAYKLVWDREANAFTLYALDDATDSRERSDDASALAVMRTALARVIDARLGQQPR